MLLPTSIIIFVIFLLSECVDLRKSSNKHLLVATLYLRAENQKEPDIPALINWYDREWYTTSRVKIANLNCSFVARMSFRSLEVFHTPSNNDIVRPAVFSFLIDLKFFPICFWRLGGCSVKTLYGMRGSKLPFILQVSWKFIS